MGSIAGLGRPPGVGNGNPLQYSCLEKPMDRGAWWAPVHGAANGPTRLSNCARSHYVLIFSIVEIEKHFKHKNTQICDSVRCQRNYIFTCQNPDSQSLQCSRSEVGPENLHFFQAPKGDAAAAGPGITFENLCLTQLPSTMCAC